MHRMMFNRQLLRLLEVLSLFAALMLLFASAAFAAPGDLTLFGPKRYDRGSGKPPVYSDTFNSCSSPRGEAMILVQNGAGVDSSLSSASIELNGTALFVESDFKNRVYSLEKLVKLRPGANSITSVLKSGGVKVPPFLVVTVIGLGCDVTPPVISAMTPAEGALMNSSVPPISAGYSDESGGSGVDVSSVRVSLDGVDITRSCSVTPTGVSCTPAPGLSEGEHSFSLTVADLARNSSTGTRRFAIDTVPPVITVSTPAMNALVNTSQITVSGTASEPLASLSINGQPVSLTSNSTFTYTFTLAEGGNSIFIEALDKAGNRGSALVPVTLDTIPPVVTVVSPAAGVIVNTPGVTISGSLSEPLSSLTVNNEPVTVNGLTFAHEIPLAAGSNGVLIVSTDKAGNVNSTSLTIERDSTPPVVTVTAPQAGLLTKSGTVQVSGTVDDLEATLNVNGAPVANSSKSFSFSYTLSEGDNAISVEAIDKAGNKGSAKVNVTLDATAPQVTLTAPLTATAGTDVQLAISATDNRALSLVDLTADGASLWSAAPNGALAAGQSLSYRLSPALSAGATVTVQGRGVDTAGNSTNATAIITIDKAADGPGWLQGKVLDDTRGLTLEGAKVRVIDTNGGQQEIITPADGSWFSELPSGLARVEISKSGYTIVNRDITVRPGQRTTVLDSRLTAIDATPRVIGTTGGTAKAPVGAALVPAQSIDITIPPSALSTGADLRLTTLSNQGLIAQLPSGWSPLAALELRLLDPATAAPLPETVFATPATVKFPLPATVTIDPAAPPVLARYDEKTHQWIAQGEAAAAQVADSTTHSSLFTIRSVGQYALLLADPAPNAPVSPVTGQALEAVAPHSSPFTLSPDLITTTGRVVPQASLPKAGLKAAGDLLLTAKADAATPPLLVSGVIVNANVTEKFDLKTGDSIQPASSTQNIILYRYPCVTNIGAGATEPPFDSAPGAVLRTTFPVAPSRDFTIVDLLKGKLSITITPLETAGGVMVGADGARLLQPDGTGLVIPAGALTSSVPVMVATLPEANVTSLIGSDFRLLRAIDLTVTGQTLKTSATLSIPAPQGIDQTLPIIVARKFDTNGVSRLKLIALATQSGTLISSTPLTPEPGSSTNSINSSGTYLFLQATAPIGYVTGQVTDSANAPFPGILTTVAGATLSDKTAIDGRYLIALATGDRTVTALDQARSDYASATATIAANSKTVLDLKVVMIPPTVIAITPANASINVQPDVPVVVTFSKPMDKSSITSETLKLNGPAGTAVTGSFTFSVDNKTVTFYPSEQFKQETGYTIGISQQLKDLQGYNLQAQVTSGFTIRRTTPPAMPAAGAISGTFPDSDGFITVTATQGSADPNDTVLLINDTTGEITSVKPATNGGFTGKVRGQLGDEIKVVLMDYSGNQTTVSYITFKNSDGSYLVTAKGGKVEGENGSILDIPEGALLGPAVIKVAAVQEASLPSPLQAPGKFLGAVNLDSGGIGFQKKVDVSIPLPAGFDPATPVFLTRPSTITNADGTVEQVYEVVDTTKVAGNRITTACWPFDGILAAGTYVFTAFPELVVGIVSGYTYQEMNEQTGYQATPDGSFETPVKNPDNTLTYKYDRPVRGAVVRSAQSWNYVSYSRNNGFYSAFTHYYNNINIAGCRDYQMVAIHPLTMQRATINGNACTPPYNVEKLNFKLAEKGTIPPDRDPPVIELSLAVAPAAAATKRIIAGTVNTGTPLSLAVTVTDLQIGAVTIETKYTAPGASEIFLASGLTQGSCGQIIATDGKILTKCLYSPTFLNSNYFTPQQDGTYQFTVTAKDVSGNQASRSVSIRAIPEGASLGTPIPGPPRVDAIYPEDKSIDIMVTTRIVAVFSEPVKNVESSFRLIDQTTGLTVPADIVTGIEGGRMQATLVPKGNLYYARNYKILLTTGITDYDTAPSAMAAEFTATFRTKDPKAYDLSADQQFSGGRDIDLYTFTGRDGVSRAYTYLLAGNNGWKIIDVTDPTKSGVIFTASPACSGDACRRTTPEFDFRSVAVHPDPNKALMAMTENINFADGNQYGYLRIYDLSDRPSDTPPNTPGNPQSIGREKLAEAYSGIPGKVALYGGYAMVNTSGVGVQIINSKQAIKNQADNKPADGSSIAGTLDTIGLGYGSPNDLSIFNERSAVFTTNPGWLLTVDPNLPTDPDSVANNAPVLPLLVNAYKPANYSFTKVGVAAGFPYIDSFGNDKTINLAITGTTQGKVVAIDLSDPASPQLLGEAVKEGGTPAIAYVRDISVSKDAGLAYVTTYNAIQVYDIKNPAKPKLLNEITSLADPSGAVDRNGNPVMIPIGETPAIVEKGGWVYLANATKGFRALDLDPVVINAPKSMLILTISDGVNKNKPVKQYNVPYKVNYYNDPTNCKDLAVDFISNGTVLWSRKLEIFEGNVTLDTDRIYDFTGDYQLKFKCTGKKSEEISEKTFLALGQLSVLDLENSTPMKGAVTDGASKLEIRLQVGKNYEKIDPPVLTLVSADDATNIGDTGTVTSGIYSGNRVPLEVKAGIGTAKASASAVYLVPDRFIRFGTTGEASDKTSPERKVQLRINSVGDNLPTITLKRPPLVLVHGLWGSAKETWDGFMLLKVGGDKLYDPVNMDYEGTNADAVSKNSLIIRTELTKKNDKLTAGGILPGKYDIVVHSMGGLLLRDMCAKNSGYCNGRFRKIVTVDTPHAGSRLANVIVDINANGRNTTCFNLLEKIDKNKVIWEPTSNKKVVKQAFIDLSEGSDLLKTLPALPIDWSAIVGISGDVNGYDTDIGLLWTGLWWYCDQNHDDLLSTQNDRIVSYSSQKGTASNVHEINEVDHVTVIGSSTLKYNLRDILENGGR